MDPHSYPKEFENINIAIIDYQLDTYIYVVRLDDIFHDVRNFNDLFKKLMEAKNNGVYSYVYLVLKLALLLLVIMMTVEITFSIMNIIKIKVRNKIYDS
jgi:hypothetical protein